MKSEPSPSRPEAEWSELETELGAPEGTFSQLIDADDWSFIIRIHALIEGAVSQLLSAAVDPRLEPLFARMGLGQRGGKLAFARHLELLNDRELAFVEALSLIRNRLAHDLKHLNFTIEQYVDDLDEKDKRRFYGALESMPPRAERSVKWAEECRSQPKACILTCTVGLVREALRTGSFHKIDREEAQLALKDMIEGRLVPHESWMEPDH